MDYGKKTPQGSKPDPLRVRAIGTGGGSGSGGMDVKQALSRGHARINRVCRTMPTKQAEAAQGSAAAAVAYCNRSK